MSSEERREYSRRKIDNEGKPELDLSNTETYNRNSNLNAFLKQLQKDDTKDAEGTQSTVVDKGDVPHSSIERIGNYYMDNTQEVLQDIQLRRGDVTAKKNNAEKSVEKTIKQGGIGNLDMVQKPDEVVYAPGVSMMSLAEIFVEVCNFIRVDDTLYYYNGFFYEKVTRQTLIAIAQESVPQHILKKITSIQRIKDTLEWMLGHKSIPRMTSSELYNENRYLIPFRNGIYNAANDSLMETSPNLHILYQINANYNEDDMDEESPCAWGDFMETTFRGDAASESILYEMLGYLLMPCNDAKKFFVIGTAPDSGKSQLANFITMVLGDAWVSCASLHDMRNRFTLASTVGRLANISMDLKAEPLSSGDIAMIKTLTGERKVSAEAKFEDPKAVFSTCKFVFGTNHPINVNIKDEAFWNRMQIIPFSYSCDPKHKKINLAELLYEERDLIMTRAAWAAHRLINNNLEFTSSERADGMLWEWSKPLRDDIDKFVEAFCTITGYKESYIEVHELYNEYQKFSENPVSIKCFTAKIRNRYTKIKENKKRISSDKVVNVIYGIQWNQNHSGE